MVKLVPIGSVKGNSRNPRFIRDEKFKKLVASLVEFPEMARLRPLVVDESMTVLGGNMRLKAMQELKWKEVPIVVAEGLTDAQKDEFVIKDNVGFGEWDWENLANEWDAEELTRWGLDIPGFDVDLELEAEEDEYEMPDELQTDIVLGDLFEIGEHRLLCGDSTDSDQVAKLMSGEKADFAIADPPYNVGYEYNSHKDNKSEKEYFDFCQAYTNNALIYSDVMAITPGKANERIYTSRPDYKEYLVWYKKMGD